MLRLDAEIDCVAGLEFARVGVVRLIGDDFIGADCDDVADELAEEFTRGETPRTSPEKPHGYWLAGNYLLRGAPAELTGAVEIAFRPHVVTLVEAGAASASGLIWLKGTVAAREFLGEFIRYVIAVGTNEIVADQAHYTDARKFAPGDAVNLGIQPEQIRVLPA